MWGFFGIPFAITLTLFFSINSAENAVMRTKHSFSLNILHTNDMYSRFAQTTAMSSPCKQKYEAAKKCYGGFARIATIVREARNSSKSTLFLNAGGTFQGDLLFSAHKWKIVAKFLNILSPDAISLGNKEFDDGILELALFLKNVTFPVVTANIDASDEPELKHTSLVKSTVLKVNGTRIGVIGYITPNTRYISSPGEIQFLPEVGAIRKEVAAMQSAGVKILIALGHSGYNMDKHIAEEVDGLDLVVGGHSNTFLYTEKHPGEHPDREVPVGDYPTVVQQKNGRKVYVVQAYAYTKYIGNLTIDFDEEGEIKHIEGRPILLDSSIVQAPDVLQELKIWESRVSETKDKLVGLTKTPLCGSCCRGKECSLGNLLNDAAIEYNRLQYNHSKFWTDAAISIVQTGIFSGFVNDEITGSDIYTLIPFKDVILKANVDGQTFREVLERSVLFFKENVEKNVCTGFLQVSGIQVVYNLSQPVGSRVSKVKVRCADCETPTFSDLEDDKVYTILLPEYLKYGGDSYYQFREFSAVSMGASYRQALERYLANHSPVNPVIEGRIKFYKRASALSYFQYFHLIFSTLNIKLSEYVYQSFLIIYQILLNFFF